jgi:hypothetical protein
LTPEPELFRYRDDILEMLERHGVRPSSRTPPGLVHDYVSDLYRYELRRLRTRLIAAEFPRSEYWGRVADVRSRYRVLALKPGQWLAGDRLQSASLS